MANKIDKFLTKYKMDIKSIDEQLFINNFINEMNKGLESKSSLKMLHTYVYNNLSIKDNTEKYIVLDAGGTNLRGAKAYLKNGKFYLSNLKKTKMLGKDKEISKVEFYSELADFTRSISKDNHNIGFCFSFGCEMNSSLDGKVLHIGKNLKMPEIIGTFVGQELVNKLNNNAKIGIINDTVATNLGIQLMHKEKGNYIGYILGTGTNICYYEDSELINVESAGFDKFELGCFEQELVNELGTTDKFEKTCGGVYFSKILNIALNKANKEGVIRLEKEANYNLKEYSQLLKDKNTNKDIKELVKKLIKRIAKLNSLVLSSAISKINNTDPYFIAIEGTTMKKLPYFEYYFKKYALERFPNLNIKFLKGQNLNLKGSLLIASNL